MIFLRELVRSEKDTPDLDERILLLAIFVKRALNR